MRAFMFLIREKRRQSQVSCDFPLQPLICDGHHKVINGWWCLIHTGPDAVRPVSIKIRARK